MANEKKRHYLKMYALKVTAHRSLLCAFIARARGLSIELLDLLAEPNEFVPVKYFNPPRRLVLHVHSTLPDASGIENKQIRGKDDKQHAAAD
jgi:hypothetical protein